jgi:hypothetical protein
VIERFERLERLERSVAVELLKRAAVVRAQRSNGLNVLNAFHLTDPWRLFVKQARLV